MPQYIGSSTVLAGGATYTSKWINTDISGWITGSAFADQAGTLFIEQSGDASHADISASYTTVASTGSGYIEQLLLPYVRLRFTNTSGSTQTAFRLFSRYIPREH